MGPPLKRAMPDNVFSDGEVIITGKFILDPPLEDYEQQVHMDGIDIFNLEEKHEKNIKNKIIYLTSTESKSLNRDPRLSDYNDRLEAIFGLNYYVVSKNRPLYLLQGQIFTGAQSKMRLPGGITFNIKAKDRAIYVGTIKFTRNDYNSITDIEIIDEYKKTNKEFRKHFGKAIKLRKSLATPTK